MLQNAGGHIELGEKVTAFLEKFGSTVFYKANNF